MEMFDIIPYQPQLAGNWNAFVDESKNATFLLRRDYMDYHSDRFADCSLMVYRRGRLYALLPASVKDGVVCSHGGLTYGGLLLNTKATTADVADLLPRLLDVYAAGNTSLIYKAIPHIYHRLPAEEDLYALWRAGARLIARDASSTIYQPSAIAIAESRKSGIRKARREGLTVHTVTDPAPFWTVLEANLRQRYGVAPVHSLTEIRLLAARFPQNIRFHIVTAPNGECLAGTCIYLCSPRVAHVQYISASPRGKECGALDLLFSQLIGQEYARIPIFDFGKSTEGDGSTLNAPLIFQKEGFGARTTVYDTYSIQF